MAQYPPTHPHPLANSDMSTCKLCPPRTEGCCHCCSSAHLFVGQQPYLSGLRAPREKTLEPRITFRKGEKCGIPVKDGILNNFRGLKDRDWRPFYGVDGIADKPALRIEVRGENSPALSSGALTIRNSGQAIILGVQPWVERLLNRMTIDTLLVSYA